MKYKLIAADFDWTLGVVPGIIEESTVSTIKLYQRAGGIFCICSGRKTESIQKICQKYDLKCDIIGYQGAQIKLADGKDIYSGGLDKSLAIEVAKVFTADDMTTLTYADDTLCISRKDKYSETYMRWNNIDAKIVPDTLMLIEQSKVIRKIMCMCEPEDMQRYLKKFRGTLSEKVAVNSGAPGLIEVVDAEHDKGNAVNFIADYYAIPVSEVMTVGDSLNDMTLINCGAYGVAVGNACDELKAVAKEVTVPFEEKPVETLIKKYCL